MMDGATIGLVLKRERERLALTREQVAERAQCTTEALALLEDGNDGNPTIGIIRDIANAMDYPIEEIIYQCRHAE